MKATVVVVCLVVVSGVLPQAASGGAGVINRDNRSMAVYLADEHIALVEVKKMMPRTGRAIERLAQKLERRCSDVALAAPRNLSRWSIEVDITEALFVAAVRT